MKHGSLFSGIGGFDLAAEWMGWTNVFHCEVNEFGKKVLEHYWPNAISFGNVTDINFRPYRGTIDIISGGFPCQPYSSAGKRLGKEDERHLWPEMLRAIREIQPRWVVGENVLGLVNWNGGLVFEEVQADLEAEGYEVQPFILPACAVNAPHRRDRVWFVAYSNERNDGRAARKDERESGAERVQERDAVRQFVESSKVQRNAPDSDSVRHTPRGKSTEVEGNGGKNNGFEKKRSKQAKRPNGLYGLSRNAPDSIRSTRWENFPAKPPLCGGDDGLSDRLDNITFPKWRNESIKAYGNAIVPQVAHQIFKAIQEYEESLLY
jgi:DNA (cytosine-5)-methyltransferase 1